MKWKKDIIMKMNVPEAPIAIVGYSKTGCQL